MSASLRILRPRQRPDLVAYPVGDELVLVPPNDSKVFTLNATGRTVWELCDGSNTLTDIEVALKADYLADDHHQLTLDLATILLELQNLRLVETDMPPMPGMGDPTTVTLSAAPGQRQVRLLYGVEDRAYFHWQLAVLFESLVGQLPAGWHVVVVICNNHAPISQELSHILSTYRVRHLTGLSHGDNHDFDFSAGGDRYVAINRVEALNVMGGHVGIDDLVCLMDTDTFLFGNLREDLFPTGNAMASNWIVGGEPFFSFGHDSQGVNLTLLLQALGCSTPFKPGGVTVFLTGDTVANKKVIQDCFRFAQVLYLLAKVNDLPQHRAWVAEMACFAMALNPNGIEYEVLDIPQFSIQREIEPTVPEGSFYHYYQDINDGTPGPFLGSPWHKQLFQDRNLLLEGVESFRDAAGSELERRFFDLAVEAKKRLYGDCC